MEAKRKRADPLEPERHRCARVEMSSNHSRDRGSTMNVTTYGLDLAKSVFQVHWIELETGEVKRKLRELAAYGDGKPAARLTTGAGCCGVWVMRCGSLRRSSCGRS